MILWIVGCPPIFVNMIKQLHRDLKTGVTLNEQVFDELPFVSDEKQSDILVPATFFSISFATQLRQRNLLYFRISAQVFNLRRLQASSATCHLLF